MKFFPVTDSETLISPYQLKRELPISEMQERFIAKSRKTITALLDRTDPRLLIVAGPCSIHDITAAKEYASKLKVLSAALTETFVLVMRVYLEKPRTTTGWKGMLYDPYLDGSSNIEAGLVLSRQLLLDLADLEVPVATEFLDPLAASYLSDLVSWGSVGARTVSSQIHRQMASGLPMPIGFKNTTDGNLDIAINALVSAKAPHCFLGMNEHGQIASIRTKGNPHTHLVLRGGEQHPNYDTSSVNDTLQRLEKAHLPLRLMVDCSHDNSEKKHEKQPLVFQDTVHQIVEGNRCIIGMILESNLFAGSQPLLDDPSRLKYGISLTDPCLDWNSTQYLLMWAQEKLLKFKEPNHNLIMTSSY